MITLGRMGALAQPLIALLFLGWPMICSVRLHPAGPKPPCDAFRQFPSAEAPTVQTHSFSRTRFFWPIFGLGLAAIFLGGITSVATAADDRAMAAPAVFTPVIPTIPESVSRPKGWPTGIPASVSQHVLSSIRDNPGGPLEPVDPEGRPLPTEQAEVVRQLIPRVRDIRRMGAAAVDLCNLAAGRLDAYYERGLAPWDFAAGALIAREAGAAILSLAEGELPGEPMLIAGPPSLARDLRAEIQRAYASLPEAGR